MDETTPPGDAPKSQPQQQAAVAHASWGRALAWAERAPASRPVVAVGRLVGAGLADPAAMLLVVLLASFLARVLWLDLPHNALIFDEAYYVQAARTLLGWAVPTGAHYAGSPVGIDPNSEHPPLGKVLMAASMLVFGDNGIGWRIPSVIAGMICLVAVYGIVRACRESAWFGVVAVAALGFENLTLVHGRIATLDILALAPVLVGSWMALRGRWFLAGLAMAVGIVIKLPAMYGVGGVGLLYVVERGPDWLGQRRIPWRDLRPMAVFVGTFALVGLVGLALLDWRFTTYTSPLDHLAHMIQYGTGLTGSAVQTQHCPGPESLPWQWLFNDCQIVYLRVDVTVKAGDQIVSSVPSIDFRGAMNPILVGLIPIGMLFAVWYARREDGRIARWAVAWAAANYLPFLVLALLSRRVMYLYYMLPTVPALSVVAVLLLLRAGMPRPVRWGLAAAYAIGFAAYFPFRTIP